MAIKGICLSLLLVATAWAADFGEIRRDVEQRPIEKSAEESSGFVTVIEADEATERVETTSDLLAESVGVQIRRRGAYGGFSTLSIRGSASNQVAIYLDGVLLNPGHIGVVNLSNLPLEGLDRIEVYRGFSPVYLGSSAIGGVVNLITKEPEVGKTSNRLGLSYGSFHTLTADLVRTEGGTRWEYLVGAHHAQSEGDFSFLDDNATRFTTDDDRWVDRRNNDFDEFGLTLKGGYRFTKHRQLSLVNDTFYKDEGVPGIGSAEQFESTRLRTFRNLVQLSLEERSIGPIGFDLKGSAFHLYFNESFSDPEGEVLFTPQKTDNQIEAFGGNLLFHSPWGEHQEWYLFTEFRRETFDPFDQFATPQRGPESSRNGGVVAAQDDLYLFNDRLVFSPALRFEVLRSDFESASVRTEEFVIPYMGVRYELGRGLDLRGNLGRYFRAPTFIELFGNAGSILGNDELRSEEGVNRDIGFRWDRPLWVFDRSVLEYAYFENDLEDLITFIQNSQRTLIAINIGSADIEGHELTLLLELWRRLLLSLNYTHQIAVNTSNSFLKGERLPGRAENELYLRVESRFHYFKPFYEFDYLGNRFLDEANLFLLESRSIHNLGVTFYPRVEGLSLTVEVKNLTDERIEDVLGFPLPGRTVFGKIEYRF